MRVLKTDSNTLIYYQDITEEKEMSVRVNAEFTDTDYAHTYYIQFKYGESECAYLPDKQFMGKMLFTQHEVWKALLKTFKRNVVLLGNTTFSGSYIIFASNLDIKWEDYIKAVMASDMLMGVWAEVSVGAYMNDNMGYYNKVLYPDSIREELALAWDKMSHVSIHRKKHFSGAFIPYCIVMDYDTDEFKLKHGSYKKQLGAYNYDAGTGMDTIEDFYHIFGSMEVALITNGQTAYIDTDEDDLTFFAINGNYEDSDVYPFAVTDQFKVKGNKKFVLKTTGGFKTVGLCLSEE